MLLQRMQTLWGGDVTHGNAPFLFAPAESTKFFEPFGWRERNYYAQMTEAVRLKREMQGMWMYKIIFSVVESLRRRNPRSSGSDSRDACCWSAFDAAARGGGRDFCRRGVCPRACCASTGLAAPAGDDARADRNFKGALRQLWREPAVGAARRRSVSRARARRPSTTRSFFAYARTTSHVLGSPVHPVAVNPARKWRANTGRFRSARAMCAARSHSQLTGPNLLKHAGSTSTLVDNPTASMRRGFHRSGGWSEGMDVVDRIYSGYGEDAGGGLRAGNSRRCSQEW